MIFDVVPQRLFSGLCLLLFQIFDRETLSISLNDLKMARYTRIFYQQNNRITTDFYQTFILVSERKAIILCKTFLFSIYNQTRLH
jgi:hypothetical protein